MGFKHAIFINCSFFIGRRIPYVEIETLILEWGKGIAAKQKNIIQF